MKKKDTDKEKDKKKGKEKSKADFDTEMNGGYSKVHAQRGDTTYTNTHFALFACPLQMYRPCDVSVMTWGSPRSNKTVSVRYRMFCTFFMFL